VNFRASPAALGVNDTSFILVDFNDGKRIVCWRRGAPASDQQVVVASNFSAYVTPNALNGFSEYRVPNWPVTPPGKKQRNVPPEWVAREPIFAW
jgi:hypothetical protein